MEVSLNSYSVKAAGSTANLQAGRATNLPCPSANMAGQLAAFHLKKKHVVKAATPVVQKRRPQTNKKNFLLQKFPSTKKY